MLFYNQSYVYHFKCQYDADYIGRIGQRLEIIINQHILANIRKGNMDNLHRWVNTSGSARAVHLLNNRQNMFSKQNMFSILRKERSYFHLKNLEAILAILSLFLSLTKFLVLVWMLLAFDVYIVNIYNVLTLVLPILFDVHIFQSDERGQKTG